MTDKCSITVDANVIALPLYLNSSFDSSAYISRILEWDELSKKF